jgi:hypothetical protein
VALPCPSPSEIRFAHEAERQVAALFDAFAIAWEYEPRTFELAWDDAGRPTRAFTPDFYLPDHDHYIEVTTLRQSLVTKKNGKARETRERYGISLTLLYRRDYESLARRYGLAPLTSVGT